MNELINTFATTQPLAPTSLYHTILLPLHILPDPTNFCDSRLNCDNGKILFFTINYYL